MAAQVAKEIFGVRRVIAKVNDPIRANLYRSQGITTFSRTSILGTLLQAMLDDDPEVGKVLLEKALAHERRLAGETPAGSPAKVSR
jgi:Trk K+ transport system NAD-binding subunit